MTVDKRSIAWASKYRSLLTGYVDAMGGENITTPRRALAEQIAVLQTELSMLTDRFASGGRGGSQADLAMYIKLSDSVAEYMRTAGLGPSLQAPIVSGETVSDARDELAKIFDRIVAARTFEEERGIFKTRDGEVIDNSGHVPQCACVVCAWERSASDEQLAEAARWRGNFAPPRRQPDPSANGKSTSHLEEPVVSSNSPDVGRIQKAASPPVPSLRVVESDARDLRENPAESAGKSRTDSAAPSPPAVSLEERRVALAAERDTLERERGRLAEEVLTNPAVRAPLNETVGQLATVETDLRQVNAAIAERQAAQPSSTAAYLEWSANGGGRIIDWSASSNPNWPRLR
jgi:hypothetical protein